MTGQDRTALNRRRRRGVARLTGTAAVATAMVVAAGCSSSSTTSTPNTSTSTPSTSAAAGTSHLTIDFVAALVNDSYFVTVRCGAQDEASKLGVTLKWTGPTTNDVTSEIQAFAAAATTNPNGMVLAPFSNTGFGGQVRPLMAKGVPVALSGETLTPPDGYITYISNFLQGGNSLAGIIGSLTGGTGTMAIIADTTGNKTDSDRYTGLVPVLKQRYPHLKVLSPQYASNSTAKGASVASAIIQGNPDLKLIYASSGPEATGVASAIKAAGDTAKIKLISFDSSPPQITLLKQNALAATIGQSPYFSGALSVKSVVDYLRAHPGQSGPVPSSAQIQATPTFLLTPQNVNTAQAQKYQYLTSCGKTQGGV